MTEHTTPPRQRVNPRRRPNGAPCMRVASCTGQNRSTPGRRVTGERAPLRPSGIGRAGSIGEPAFVAAWHPRQRKSVIAAFVAFW